MALTRKFLSGLGLTEEQSQAIIEAHTETTDALKDQRDNYKADAEKLKDVQKELNDLKANDKGDEWQKKYEKEHSDFEAYKNEITTKETNHAKTEAYKELLKTAGVAEKRIDAIMKVTSLDDLTLTDDGKLDKLEELKKNITETWSDFIETTETKGAETKTPPETGGGTITQEEFDKMGYTKRLELFNSDRETYDRLSGAKTE